MSSTMGIPGLYYGLNRHGLYALNEAIEIGSLRRTTIVIAEFVAKWSGLRTRKM